MEKPSMEYLFEEVALSGHVVIDDLLILNKELNSISVSRKAIEEAKKLFHFDNHTVTLPCLYCDDRSVFKFWTAEIHSDGNYLGYLANTVMGLRYAGAISHDIRASKEGFLVLAFEFECARDTSHHYQMLLRLDLVGQKDSSNRALKITKIGQYPEPYLLKRESYEYAKALDSFGGKQDYLTGERCYYTGLYSGAYVYLRRCYEKLIRHRLTEKGLDPDSNERVADKIASIKDMFDPDIQGKLAAEYGSLSAGVHSLSDEECREHYLGLREIIDVELEHIDYLQKKQKRIAKAEASITSITEAAKK